MFNKNLYQKHQLKKKRKHPVRHFIGQIHLWLGLASGLVVFIVSLTGAIFTFQDDIRDIIEPWRFVQQAGQTYLPPSRLQAVALKKHPEAKTNRIVYMGKDRSAAVLLLEDKSYLYVFVDPYSGKILKEQNLKKDFFTVIQFIHISLLLPNPVGKYIIGISIIIFVLMLISGIVLWWPKRKTDRKRSFTIRWNGRWKRVNYDLHNVLGFYTFSILLIISITGLSMSFNWVRDGLYKTANLGRSYATDKRPEFSLDTTKVLSSDAVDRSLILSAQKSPRAEMFLIFPAQKNGAPISVSAYSKTLHYAKSDQYFFDPGSGEFLSSTLHSSKSAGAKLNAANYDLHTGQILGFTGKIIAFIASMISASLPVTGLIIWLGKKKKKWRPMST